MRLCVYCASQPGNKPIYRDSARELGLLLAEQGIGLVYGGNLQGLMGEVASAALEAGGEVIGIMPRVLATIEHVHPGLTELHFVETLHERKAKMIELSNGSIIMPGACGTMDELFEQLTWLHVGLHDKPCAIFNVNGFYAHLIALIERMVEDGFLLSAHRDGLIVADTPAALLEKFHAWKPLPPVWGLRYQKETEAA